MNIGIYSPYLKTTGGGERYMLTAAECLSHENDVFILWQSKNDIRKLADSFLLNLSRVQCIPNIFLKKKSIIARYKNTKNFNLMIILSDGSIPLTFSKYTIIHFQQPIINKSAGSLKNKFKLRNAILLCNSKFTKQTIDKVFGISARVLYPPVDIDYYSPNESKKNLILTVGRISPDKKLDVLISSFEIFSKSYPDWFYVIAGGLQSQDQKYFDSILSKIENSKSIRIIPNCGIRKLRSLYEEAMFLWHAKGVFENPIKHPERMEHFGIAPVEAMAAGCIPLAFNGGGLREVITHKKDGFLWNNEKELLEITSWLINHRKQCTIVAREGVITSGKFSKDKFCKSLKEIIKSL